MYGSVSNATQPSFLTKDTGAWANGTSKYIDLAQSASLVNRRTYRSGMIYPFSIEVAPFTSAEPGARTMFVVQTLPNTFIVRQSFKLAKESFLKATEEEREMVKSARWNDFRVLYDLAHKSAGTNILPDMVSVDGTTAALDTGYEYSYLSNRDSAGDDQYFGFFGAGTTTYLAMLQEYYISLEASQAVPDPPVTISTMPYDSIIEQVDPEDAEALQTVNEYPPYDEYLLQSQVQTHFIGFQNGTGNTAAAYPLKTSTPILLAPCGLIKITGMFTDKDGGAIESLGNVNFRVNMLNGRYRGIEAGKMI